MTKIYDQHAAAFRNVSAFVILKDGERVATVALKFPADGAGRLYAYVHWIGLEMVRGFAGGYGYDKASAAVSAAVNAPAFVKSFNEAVTSHRADDEAFHYNYHAFRAAAAKDGGYAWVTELCEAGFDVIQAV